MISIKKLLSISPTTMATSAPNKLAYKTVTSKGTIQEMCQGGGDIDNGGGGGVVSLGTTTTTTVVDDEQSAQARRGGRGRHLHHRRRRIEGIPALDIPPPVASPIDGHWIARNCQSRTPQRLATLQHPSRSSTSSTSVATPTTSNNNTTSNNSISNDTAAADAADRIGMAICDPLIIKGQWIVSATNDGQLCLYSVSSFPTKRNLSLLHVESQQNQQQQEENQRLNNVDDNDEEDVISSMAATSSLIVNEPCSLISFESDATIVHMTTTASNQCPSSPTKDTGSNAHVAETKEDVIDSVKPLTTTYHTRTASDDSTGIEITEAFTLAHIAVLSTEGDVNLVRLVIDKNNMDITATSRSNEETARLEIQHSWNTGSCGATCLSVINDTDATNFVIHVGYDAGNVESWLLRQATVEAQTTTTSTTSSTPSPRMPRKVTKRRNITPYRVNEETTVDNVIVDSGLWVLHHELLWRGGFSCRRIRSITPIMVSNQPGGIEGNKINDAGDRSTAMAWKYLAVTLQPDIHNPTSQNVPSSSMVEVIDVASVINSWNATCTVRATPSSTEDEANVPSALNTTSSRMSKSGSLTPILEGLDIERDLPFVSLPLEEHWILPDASMGIINAATLPSWETIQMATTAQGTTVNDVAQSEEADTTTEGRRNSVGHHHHHHQLPRWSPVIPSHGSDCSCIISPTLSQRSSSIHLPSLGIGLSDGTVTLLTGSNNGLMSWGIAHDEHQLLLSHPAIGCGTIEYSDETYFVCCLRGGTTYLIPAATSSADGLVCTEDILVVSYPHDADASIRTTNQYLQGT